MVIDVKDPVIIPAVAPIVLPAAVTQVVRKHFIAEVKRIDEDGFEADVVISTGTLDRDKEIVDPKGMTLPKPERIPLVAGHAYGDLTKQIGEVQGIAAGDKKITARPKWYVGEGNAQADWAWTLAKKGVAAFSVGFMPLEIEAADLSDEKVLERVRDGKEPVRTFRKWELVEVSQVIVPSNRQAVQRLVDAGVLNKEQAEPIMAKAKDEPLSDEATKALDEALASYKASEREPVVDVNIAALLQAAGASDVDSANPVIEDDVLILFDEEKGRGQNAPVADERIREEGEVPATVPTPGPGPVAGADRQKPEPRQEWRLRMPDLEAALAAFKSSVELSVTKIVEVQVSEAVKQAVAEHVAGQPQLPADSAAFVSAKDIIDAIVPQVMDAMRREIAKARGNVDFFRREA